MFRNNEITCPMTGSIKRESFYLSYGSKPFCIFPPIDSKIDVRKIVMSRVVPVL